MNRFIPATLHGYLNYIVAIISISSPWLFGFSDAKGGALFIPIYFGVLQLVLATFTNYGAGAIKQAPLELHLALDVLVGFFVMISPLLYDFGGLDYGIFWPHFLLGLYTLLSGVFTVIPQGKHAGFFTATA